MKMNKLVEAKAFEVNNLFYKHFPLSFPITIVDKKTRIIDVYFCSNVAFLL